MPPAMAQTAGAKPAEGTLNPVCREAGLTVASQILDDLPMGGPIALASWREIDRDLTLEERIAKRLTSLGFTIDEAAPWQLIYETDAQAADRNPRFSIYSEIQEGKEPVAQGRYSIERDGEICPPTSVYRMRFEIRDPGARTVWRATATHVTRTAKPTADKDRLADRLLSQLRADLRTAHNQPGGME